MAVTRHTPSDDNRTSSVLDELIHVSQTSFGFFTGHRPHTINYPWAVSKLSGLPAGARLLDIGTGVSPVPVFLAEHGLFVDCVDNSEIVRTLGQGTDWNEWGFFDYADLHANLKSFNVSIADHTPAGHYDAIYSVSSMSPMPRPLRDETFRRCQTWLKSGGLLVLTLDLVSGTDRLWDRGHCDAPIEPHGTYREVEALLSSLGFSFVESGIDRSGINSLVDWYFLVATV